MDNIIEYIVVFILHLVLIFGKLSSFQNILVKHEDSLIHINNIYLVPLSHMMNICNVTLIYICSHFFLQMLFGVSLPEFILPILLEYFRFCIYTTILLTILYAYVEYYTSFTKHWNRFAHESSAQRMIIMIAMLTLIIYVYMHFVFKSSSFISSSHFFDINPNSNDNNITVLICGLVFVSFLNFLKKTQPIHYITKMIAFIFALLFV